MSLALLRRAAVMDNVSIADVVVARRRNHLVDGLRWPAWFVAGFAGGFACGAAACIAPTLTWSTLLLTLLVFAIVGRCASPSEAAVLMRT